MKWRMVFSLLVRDRLIVRFLEYISTDLTAQNRGYLYDKSSSSIVLSSCQRESGASWLSLCATLQYATREDLIIACAPVWNKPKVEESVTIHNIPGGIPLDFLKLLIPDAITIELDDDQLQFTQEARRVRLGLNRKTGGDRILKLFTQLYINNEYAVLTQGLTDSFDVPELKEILKQKKPRGKVAVSESSHREVRAVSRDINNVPIVVDSEDEAEVIMKVENAEVVDRILRGKASAWRGPSTAGQLRQALKEETKVTNIPRHSDVNEDLSDISDTSDIGEGSSSQQKTHPKSQGAVRRKTSSTNLASSRYGDNLSSHTTQQKSKDPDLPPSEDRDRRSFEAERDRKGKSKSVTSSEGRRGQNRQQASSPSARYSDRFQPLDRSGHSSPSQRSRDRSVHGEKPWQETGEQTDKGKFDRSSKEMGRYERGGVEVYEHEARIIKGPLSSRDILRRERLELERNERERLERLKKLKPKRAKGMSRSSISPLRSDRKRRRSEEPDFTRQRGVEVRDRHGHIIVQPAVNKADSGRPAMADRFDQHGGDYGRRDDLSKYEEDSRRGRVSERLGSLERRRGSREREERDERRVIRTRSPLTRHVIRGRSASPRRGSSPSRSQHMARRFSPSSNRSPMRRVTIGRKSTSPRRFPVRGSPLSPISVGDDSEEPGSGLGEGMWLTQPPSAFDTARYQGQRSSSHIQTVAGRAAREDLRKSGPQAATSKNLVAVQTDQQAQRYGNPSRDSAGKDEVLSAESRNILQRFVEEMIATSRAQSTFQAAVAKELSSNFGPGFNDPVKLLEKIKDMWGSNTQAQTSNTRTVGSFSSGTEGFSSGRLATGQAFSHADTIPRSSVTIQAGSFDTIPSFERNLPPPIPPPVAPPLFTPTATSQDRISQMEALAKQLAADIEKQQTQPPPASQGVWSVPPPASMPPHMMGPPPNMRGPGSIPHGGPVPYPNMPGQPQMRPPNIPPPQDRGPPPMWPPAPRSNFF